jgi:hypothetical protein
MQAARGQVGDRRAAGRAEPDQLVADQFRIVDQPVAAVLAQQVDERVLVADSTGAA